MLVQVSVPVEALVLLQLVERPVVEPQRHVVFRAVCLLPAQVRGVVDDLRDAWAGGVVYGYLRRGAQVVDPLVVLGVVSVVVHKVEVDAVRARCREVEGKVVAGGAQCVSSRGFEQKEHRKLSSLSIGSAHAF